MASSLCLSLSLSLILSGHEKARPSETLEKHGSAASISVIISHYLSCLSLLSTVSCLVLTQRSSCLSLSLSLSEISEIFFRLSAVPDGMSGPSAELPEAKTRD